MKATEALLNEAVLGSYAARQVILELLDTITIGKITDAQAEVIGDCLKSQRIESKKEG